MASADALTQHSHCPHSGQICSSHVFLTSLLSKFFSKHHCVGATCGDPDNVGNLGSRFSGDSSGLSTTCKFSGSYSFPDLDTEHLLKPGIPVKFVLFTTKSLVLSSALEEIATKMWNYLWSWVDHKCDFSLEEGLSSPAFKYRVSRGDWSQSFPLITSVLNKVFFALDLCCIQFFLAIFLIN